MMTDYDLTVAPVIDEHEAVVGVITVDDVLELMLPRGWRRRFDLLGRQCLRRFFGCGLRLLFDRRFVAGGGLLRHGDRRLHDSRRLISWRLCRDRRVQISWRLGLRSARFLFGVLVAVLFEKPLALEREDNLAGSSHPHRHATAGWDIVFRRRLRSGRVRVHRARRCLGNGHATRHRTAQNQ